MRRLLVLAAAFGLMAAPARADDLAPTTVCRVGSGVEMLCLHNYARKMHELTPLTARADLFVSAGHKADDIEASGVFSHAPVGAPWDVYFAQGYQTWGENLAYGYRPIRAAFRAWLGSPGHLANILRPEFRYYGSSFRPSGLLPAVWATNFGG